MITHDVRFGVAGKTKRELEDNAYSKLRQMGYEPHPSDDLEIDPIITLAGYVLGANVTYKTERYSK